VERRESGKRKNKMKVYSVEFFSFGRGVVPLDRQPNCTITTFSVRFSLVTWWSTNQKKKRNKERCTDTRFPPFPFPPATLHALQTHAHTPATTHFHWSLRCFPFSFSPILRTTTPKPFMHRHSHIYRHHPYTSTIVTNLRISSFSTGVVPGGREISWRG
jgi:hypothetical protein